jgi:hypothetical protein
MNAPKNDSRDQILHENLRRIAQQISLPARSAEVRRAGRAAGAQPRNEAGAARRKGRLIKLWPFLTSAVTAAGIMAAVVILANPRSVSAETIFRSLRAVLGGPLSVRLDNISFGGVSANGRIRTGGEAVGAPGYYSEIHLVLKADNPQWSDMDVVTVLNDAPERSWLFVRGAGGEAPQAMGADGLYHVKLTEQYYAGRLPEFLRTNILDLSSVPAELSFGQSGSWARYVFGEPERKYLRSVLELAQHIGEAADAEELIGRLRTAAGQVQVEAAERGCRLRATAFRPAALFPELDLNVADLDVSVLSGVSYSVEFVDPGSRYYTLGGAERLRPFRVSIDTSALRALADEASSAEAFARRAEALAREVTVERGTHGGSVVRVSGCDWKIDASERERIREIATQIIPGIELIINYDPQANSVSWAEFRNLTLNTGSIRFEPASTDLEAARDPNQWITEDTLKYGD